MELEEPRGPKGRRQRARNIHVGHLSTATLDLAWLCGEDLVSGLGFSVELAAPMELAPREGHNFWICQLKAGSTRSAAAATSRRERHQKCGGGDLPERAPPHNATWEPRS